MGNIDSLKPEDEVSVTIFGPDASELYSSTISGFHNIESAINASITNANLKINPQDCIFEVNNKTKDVTHRYRFNAHDNIKLII